MRWIKITTAIIMLITIITTTYNYVYAADSIDAAISEGDNFLSQAEEVAITTEDMQDFSGILYNVLLAVGIVIAVIIGIVLGMKYMYSGVEGKAEEKKKLIAYVIGCSILFGGFGIWKTTVGTLQKTDSVTVSSTHREEGQAGITETTSNEVNQSNSEQSTAPNRTPLITEKKIILNQTYLIVDMRQTKSVKLIASIVPTDTSKKEKIVWSSNKKKVATVNSNGKVTFKKAGTVRIRAKLKSNSAVYRDCTIVIKNTIVEKVELDRNILMLDDRHYNIAFLECNVTSENKNEKVKWSSSNKDIVTVNQQGKVTAKKEGIATIMAKASNGKTATCRVRVIAPMTVNLSGGGKWAKSGQEGVKWNVADIQYSKTELEAYVNNIEKVFKTEEGQNKYSEARRHTVTIWDEMDGPKRSVVKEKGELAINDYLAIVSTRNQMFYGFKKKENGEWKLDITSTTSTGNAMSSSYFKMYLVGPVSKDGNGNDAIGCYKAPVFREGIVGGRNGLGNVFHPGWIADTQAQSVPSSHGCVHIGDAYGKLYNWVAKACGGLRVIYIGPTKSSETSINNAYDDQGYDMIDGYIRMKGRK